MTLLDEVEVARGVAADEDLLSDADEAEAATDFMDLVRMVGDSSGILPWLAVERGGAGARENRLAAVDGSTAVREVVESGRG